MVAASYQDIPLQLEIKLLQKHNGIYQDGRLEKKHWTACPGVALEPMASSPTSTSAIRAAVSVSCSFNTHHYRSKWHFFEGKMLCLKERSERSID
jgi:hypothetical protein